MKDALVTNKDTAKTSAQFQGVICNLLPKATRFETLEDRPYIAVPMVMLVEGVHSGSGGPLFYSNEEIGKTPVVWNHKPVVVYHPERDGVGISACDPTIIQNRKVGLIFNSTFDKGRLKAEAWIEKDRADKVDERIMEAITKNSIMELSTGLFCDVENTEGEWNNQEYVGIARNFRPDHLALLPDKTGACSIAKGAGFLRNAQQIEKELQAKAGKKGFGELRAQLGAMGLGHLAQQLTGNQMSFGNIQEALSAALRKKLNFNTETGPWVWICDVYSNFFIYEQDGKLLRLGYEAGDLGVTLSDEKATEVRRVAEYRTVEGAYVGNQDQPKQVNNESMNKAQTILAILAAGAASGWSETDRPVLEKMTEAQLTGIHNGIKQPQADPKKALIDSIIGNNGWTEADRPMLNNFTDVQLGRLKAVAQTAPAAPAAAAAGSAAKAEGQQTTTTNATQPATFEQWMSQAPKQFQDLVANSLDSVNREKSSMVEVILKNANNTFTKEELDAMAPAALRKLSKLGGVQNTTQPNYAGMAPVSNAEPVTEDVMEPPTMNFATAK